MKRKNIIRAAAGSVLAVLVVGGYFATRTYAYTAYGATTAISNYGMAAMTNPNEPTNINAAQSYDLKMNGTRVWELNKYAAPQTGANPPTNQGYMFVLQSQLSTNPDGSRTSFSGGYGNEQFVAQNLINGSQYTWAINGPGTSEPGNNYYALSDILDMNGMTAPAFNGSTVWPTGGQNLYAPQTSLSVGNVTLPHIAPTLTDSSGAQVSTIAPSGTYYINPNISSYGSNGGGYFSKSYLSAYWLPVTNGTVGSYQYALTTNNSGSATIYGWPDPLSVQASGGLSSATGYFSGFPGGFEQVPYGTSPSQSELAVKAPSTFPSGVTAYDLVVFYGDSVERYDAQVLQVQAKAPTQTTCPNVSLSVSGSGKTGTLAISDPSNAALTLSASNGASLSKTSVSSSTTVSINMPAGTPGQAESTTITAKDSSAADSSCPPATVSYSYTPPALNGLTLSANPTSQTVGKDSTLTADYTGSTPIGSSPIVIHDLGGRYTLNNGGTTTYTGFDGQTTATTTALANSAYTESYDATVTINGKTETSNTVSITWSAAAPTGGTSPVATTSLTLAANPTQLQVGSPTTLTVTIPPDSTGFVTPNEYVQVMDQSTGQVVGMGYYTGTSNMTTGYNANGQYETMTETYTDNTSESQTFIAQLWNPGVTPWNNPSSLTSNTQTVTWTKPSVTLSASPTSPFSSQASQLSFTTTGWQTGDYVDVSSSGGVNGWYATNDTNSSDSYAEVETPTNGQSITNTITAKMYNSSGVLLSTSTITVTWLAPTVVITHSPTGNLELGEPVHLYATGKNMASNDYITITDSATGKVIATGQPGQTFVEVDVTKYQAINDTFIASIKD